MGLRNFLNRGGLSAKVDAPAAAVTDSPGGQEPLPQLEQLADLEVARAELLQLAAEAGVKSLNACPRDGSRWQDDPATIRTITAVIREVHLEEQLSTDGAGLVR